MNKKSIVGCSAIVREDAPRTLDLNVNGGNVLEEELDLSEVAVGGSVPEGGNHCFLRDKDECREVDSSARRRLRGMRRGEGGKRKSKGKGGRSDLEEKEIYFLLYHDHPCSPFDFSARIPC